MADGHALPELNWRLATSVPPTIEFYEGAVTFAEEVERMTNGKFKIRVFAGGELPAFGVFDAVLTARSKWATPLLTTTSVRTKRTRWTPPYLSA